MLEEFLDGLQAEGIISIEDGDMLIERIEEFVESISPYNSVEQWKNS